MVRTSGRRVVGADKPMESISVSIVAQHAEKAIARACLRIGTSHADSDLQIECGERRALAALTELGYVDERIGGIEQRHRCRPAICRPVEAPGEDRKSTRLNS